MLIDYSMACCKSFSVTDDSIHGEKSSGANGNSGAGLTQPRQNQGRRDGRLEKRAAVRPAFAADQFERLPHYPDTVRRLCKLSHFLSSCLSGSKWRWWNLRFSFKSSRTAWRSPSNCNCPSCWPRTRYVATTGRWGGNEAPTTRRLCPSSALGSTRKRLIDGRQRKSCSPPRQAKNRSKKPTNQDDGKKSTKFNIIYIIYKPI